MVTVAASTAVPSGRLAKPMRCPRVGAAFQERTGTGAGSLKSGIEPAGSYSVTPFTDLLVVSPDANSANGRSGVFCPAGIEKGFAVTATFDVAIEKKITPAAVFPLDDGSSKTRRVWRSDPSTAFRNTPTPITPARLY